MVRKVFSALARSKASGRGRFFYPRNGFGQICEAYCHAARDAGADICLGARVQSVEIEGNSVKRVRYEMDEPARSRFPQTMSGQLFQSRFWPSA